PTPLFVSIRTSSAGVYAPAQRPGFRSSRAESPTWRRIAYSYGHSLWHAGLIAHDGNEQVGDVGGAHLAERGKLPPIGTIEQQDAAAEHLALVHRLERPRGGHVLGVHHHLQVARLEFFHAAIEHDA